jgi:hypothetical protein
MKEQHTGGNKCDHNQQAQSANQSTQPKAHQRNKQTPPKRSQAKRSQQPKQLISQRKAKVKLPNRESWCLLVCVYYFGALYFNSYIYSLDYSADGGGAALTSGQWESYFFNACLIALSGLVFIAFMPDRATTGEKIYSVAYFVSLAMSALLYDDFTNGWWFLNDLDIVMQYGITAVLGITSGWYLCRLLRFCYAYLVSSH